MDRPGDVYGRLCITAPASKSSFGKTRWLCLCECGRQVIVEQAHIRSGHTTYCGCMQKERTIETHRTHGLSEHPLYGTWENMHKRCSNPHAHNYRYYGALGVKVCRRWQKFENFLADMGERPEGKTLDRFPDNTGNYEPGNCRWATTPEQQRNRRWGNRG